jgi:hypothetical protein
MGRETHVLASAATGTSTRLLQVSPLLRQESCTESIERDAMRCAHKPQLVDFIHNGGSAAMWRLLGVLLLIALVDGTRKVLPINLNPGYTQGSDPQTVWPHGPHSVIVQTLPPRISTVSDSPGLHIIDTERSTVSQRLNLDPELRLGAALTASRTDHIMCMH